LHTLKTSLLDIVTLRPNADVPPTLFEELRIGRVGAGAPGRRHSTRTRVLPALGPEPHMHTGRRPPAPIRGNGRSRPTGGGPERDFPTSTLRLGRMPWSSACWIGRISWPISISIGAAIETWAPGRRDQFPLSIC